MYTFDLYDWIDYYLLVIRQLLLKFIFGTDVNFSRRIKIEFAEDQQRFIIVSALKIEPGEKVVIRLYTVSD